MGRKLDLGRFIRKQRVEGGLMSGVGAYVPGAVAPASHDAEAILDAIDAHLTDDAPLMAREWVTLALTDILKSVKSLDVVGPRCEAIAARLSAMDERAFGSLQLKLQDGAFGPRDLREELARRPAHEADPFVLRLFGLRHEPTAEKAREQQMVHYKASPVAVAFELAEALTPDDVLFDLGSGLGVVPILVAWLAQVRAVGVELEPAFNRVARGCLERFSVPGVRVIESDARTVDYREATAVYLFDPFRGEILSDVMARVAEQAPEAAVYALGGTTAVFDVWPSLALDRRLPSGTAVYRQVSSAA